MKHLSYLNDNKLLSKHELNNIVNDPKYANKVKF